MKYCKWKFILFNLSLFSILSGVFEVVVKM